MRCRSDRLRDPETLEQRTKDGKKNWLITLGVCTHLGCIPLGINEGDNRGKYRRLFLPVPRVAIRHRGAHPPGAGAEEPRRSRLQVHVADHGLGRLRG